MTKCLTNIMNRTEGGKGAKMYMQMIDSKITYTDIVSTKKFPHMFKHV